MIRDPKQDPKKGDIIRWGRISPDGAKDYVAIVTDRNEDMVYWVDVLENGYADSECAPIEQWREHKGIQSGILLWSSSKEDYDK